MSDNNESQSVSSNFAEVWKPEKPGETRSGVYLGSQVVAEGRKGAFTAFHFQSEDKSRWSISGAALESIMAQIPRKTRCDITYQGMERLRNGNDMKTFDVKVPKGTKMIDPFEDRD